MKTCLLALLLMLPAVARADRTWRTADTVREVAWQVIDLADMGTTIDAAKRNDEAGRQIYGEKNPLIGFDPSPARVRNMMLLGAVAHAGVSYLLPHGWRDAWQYVTILESAHCVDHNISIGLHIRF